MATLTTPHHGTSTTRPKAVSSKVSPSTRHMMPMTLFLFSIYNQLRTFHCSHFLCRKSHSSTKVTGTLTEFQIKRLEVEGHKKMKNSFIKEPLATHNYWRLNLK